MKKGLLKKYYKKLKYLDRTKSIYFSLYIVLFCFLTFIGGTYAYFSFFNVKNAATITLANPQYELNSNNAQFSEGKISIDGKKTIRIELNLKSLNDEETRYAINYRCDNPDVKVYYDKERLQNVTGIIASKNSTLDAAIIIENDSDTQSDVFIEVVGGYVENELDSNIENGYVYSSEKTLKYLNLSSKPGSPAFENVATTDEGIYSMTDDFGTSYYFRGAPTSNYFYFAGFYWRIVRINGDGSVRLIYDGTKAHNNGESDLDRSALSDVAFNDPMDDNKYVGYMYGKTKPSTSYETAHTNEMDSTIKQSIDTWYETNIADKGYSKYVADEIFCNDRTPSNDKVAWSPDTGLAYGKNNAAYAPFLRIRAYYPTLNPSLICSSKNDKFTVDDTIGNGALTYPVGLLTADEVVLAGINYLQTNTTSYLYKGHPYWLLSPNGYAEYFSNGHGITETGGFTIPNMNTPMYVAPVINIKPEYIITDFEGTGVSNQPYNFSH